MIIKNINQCSLPKTGHFEIEEEIILNNNDKIYIGVSDEALSQNSNLYIDYNKIHKFIKNMADDNFKPTDNDLYRIDENKKIIFKSKFFESN